ncbi:SDR family oxidoreductase [Pygmaiobacter massiliensis]|uniref:SDR family NAD(P)-dependent oxidoreductase n=1 Tax=Pygmaiobacter massiliensis TaxID=1917873 RepID=UPI002A839156|nr:SDR family oxidoreductase [Pygmaiobacter massiliensis]MDY4784953.1 SDR family oxidoreductase [Pygmaiobacter massiliensis]
MPFENNWYLIVGGSSGIGLSTAQALCAQGAHVVLAARSSERLAHAMKTLPQGNLAFSTDLSNPSRAREAFDFCREQQIILNGMLYSAGVSPLCLLADNTPELMEQTFQLNLFSFIEMTKYFQQEQFSKEGSSIVGVASIAAQGSGYRQTLYGASKAAMIAAAKLMSRELLNRKIRINTISPSATDTPLLTNLKIHSTNLEEKIRATQPLGMIPPDAVAQAIMFLLSDASSYLTGTDLVYDGGALLK